jgi:hypothetical protein
MKKTILTLSILALIASGCNQATKKQNETATMPSHDYVGLWKNDTNPAENHIIIQEINDSEIVFELTVFNRTCTSGMAKIEGDKITFSTGVDATGTMEFNENGITLTVATAPIGYLKVGEIYNFNVKVEKKLSEKKLKHYYHYNYFSTSFFDDGTATESSSPDKEFTYKETPTTLSMAGESWNLFDDFGHITGIELTPYFEIINFHKVNSRMQITNFEENTEKNAKSDIQHISETCLIFITPENGYEELVWYRSDRENEFAEKGILSVDAKKRYLSFALADGEKFVIDTRKEQNGKITPSALLYRKGFVPIMICISGESEEGKKMIEKYLQ